MDEPNPKPEPEPLSESEAADSGERPNQDACMFAMLAHLLGALIGFIGPLIIWLVKKDEDAFVDDQGKEALNFQLTLLIAYVVLGVASFVTCGLSSLLMPVVFVVQIILGIMGAVKANTGEPYRYPFSIPLIK